MMRHKDNLFDMQKNASVMDKVENDRYVVEVYFKGSVIAFDKISKEYFIVFIHPNHVALWIEKLSFVKDSINKLAISIASTTDKDELSKGIGADWIIDLEEKIFL
ncbi:MAG: hypothetical protein ACTFAL_15380 [Candidatus Electronema sp. V4]|uniref:hypothetical protein n=1 Tax=Candidatus Electronema sp. V4 TaxID=3454756 RepID=UPI00405545EF